MKTFDRTHELFLNYACNAKCPFCYNPAITEALLRLDLSYEQAVRSLYAGASKGAKRLNLHGGEVTLRDDLMKILRMARKLGYEQVTVVTNGVRLGAKPYVRRLRDSGATHIRLSIHAAAAPLHDEIVAIPGAFDKAVKAVGHVRDAGLALGMNYVLIRRNAVELPLFLSRFCVGEGVDDVIVYFPHFRGMMAVNAVSDGLNYLEALPHVRAGAELLRRARKLKSVLFANFPPCVAPELRERLLDWKKGYAEGDAMTHPEGFTESMGEMKHGQKTHVAACRTCALRSECMGVDREYAALYGGTGLHPVAA